MTTCSGAEATLPSLPDLPEIAALPDPFQSIDGSGITTAAQWKDCRRAEIAAQAQVNELGDKPARPESVSGSFADGTLTVTVTNAGHDLIPRDDHAADQRRVAALPRHDRHGGIAIAPAQLNAMGVATIIFPNDTVAQRTPPRSGWAT